MESESEAERKIDSEKKKSQEGQQISEKDMRSAFKAVDIDKSGEISKRVSPYFTSRKNLSQVLLQELNMAVKYLSKRYGLKDVRNLTELWTADYPL